MEARKGRELITTVIFKSHDNGTTIGFDSRTTQGNHSHQGGTPKVFANGDVVIGLAGDLKDARTLQYAEIPQLSPEDWDVDKYVSTELLPALRAALEAADALTVVDDMVRCRSEWLMVVRGRIYEVSRDLSWLMRADGVHAIGSGWAFAMGALTAGASIRQALEIAALHDTGTGDHLEVIQAEELWAA